MEDSASFIAALNINLPESSASAHLSPSRIQHIKRALQATFPNVSGAVVCTAEELGFVKGVPGLLVDFISAKSASLSPVISVGVDGLSAAMATALAETSASIAGSLSQPAWRGAIVYTTASANLGYGSAVWFEDYMGDASFLRGTGPYFGLQVPAGVKRYEAMAMVCLKSRSLAYPSYAYLLFSTTAVALQAGQTSTTDSTSVARYNLFSGEHTASLSASISLYGEGIVVAPGAGKPAAWLAVRAVEADE